jgi:hypothetical protein
MTPKPKTVGKDFSVLKPKEEAMQKGEAYWTYDDEAGAWYFGLRGRAKPPYLKQRRVEAILDFDAEGRLAGVELLEAIEPSREEPA